MQVKLQKIGNSIGAIFPKDELVLRHLGVGDTITVEFTNDPFWESLECYTIEDRRRVDAKERFTDDDLSEWGDI